MTSLRQIEANRRNAVKSTGPITEQGKHRSRQNAVRHGLCAETVVEIVEDVDGYRGFEAATIAIAAEYEKAALKTTAWMHRPVSDSTLGCIDLEQLRHPHSCKLRTLQAHWPARRLSTQGLELRLSTSRGRLAAILCKPDPDD